jgi:predicted RNase H-like HicB family nuclease
MILDVPYRFAIRPQPRTERRPPDRISGLRGCMSDGGTIEAAITNGIHAMLGWIEAMRAGHPVPHQSAPLRHEPITGVPLAAGSAAET